RRDDRNAVLRMGTGRAVIGAAGGVLSRTSKSGPQRSTGLVGLPDCRRGVSDRRSRTAPSHRCRGFRQADGNRSVARGAGRHLLVTRPVRRAVAARRGGGKVSPGPVFRLATAGDGRTDAVERRLL